MVMYNVYVYAAQEDYVLHKWYEKSVSTKPKGKPSQGAHLASVRHVIAVGRSVGGNTVSNRGHRASSLFLEATFVPDLSHECNNELGGGFV